MFQIKTFCKSTITRLAWTLRQLAKPMAYELPFVLFFVVVNNTQIVYKAVLVTYAILTGNNYSGGGYFHRFLFCLSVGRPLLYCRPTLV